MKRAMMTSSLLLGLLALLFWDCQPERKTNHSQGEDKQSDQKKLRVRASLMGDTFRPIPPITVPKPPIVTLPGSAGNGDYTKEYRLVACLKYIQASDAGSINTQDEIQLHLRGLEFYKEVANLSRDILPTEGRDVYLMGKNANDSLRVLLYQGLLREKDPASGAQHFVEASLNINEQDNAQLGSLEQLASSAGKAGAAFLSSKLGQTGVSSTLIDQAVQDFGKGIGSLYNSYKTTGKSPLGAIGIIVRRGANNPQLITAPTLGEQRIDPIGINDNDVTYRLRAGQAEYLLRLRLEEVPSNAGPFQRTVFITESADQANKNELIIQSIDAAVRVKRGETKRFFVPKEKFWWYGDNAREETNLNAYYIEAMKELNGSNIRWRGFRIEEDEVGAIQNGLSHSIKSRGVLPPLKGRKYLDDTHDACNDPVLMVQSIDGFVSIGKGESKLVRVPSNRIWWYCGGSREWTTAPVGTNYVYVTRSTGGAFSWTCYQETTPPARAMRYLSSDHDACNDNVLTIQSTNGTVSIAKGKSAGFFVPSRTIWWYCGGARESTTLPEGTNYVIVTRSVGGAFTWDCYKHSAVPANSLSYLGSTHEASNEAYLIVQTSTGSMTIGKGETKTIRLPRNMFWWYSGEAREWTTAPEGCNYVVMTRSASGGAFSMACYRDKDDGTSLAYKGNTNDMCGEGYLGIVGLGQTVQIGKGQTKGLRVYSNRVEWICGSSREASTLPAGTNYVYVTRSASGRAFTWECYHDTKQQALELLGTETDACGDNSLSMFDRNGRRVWFSKGGVKDIAIGNRNITWFCDDTREESTLPPGTNYVSVARGTDGGKIWWNCYRVY